MENVCVSCCLMICRSIDLHSPQDSPNNMVDLMDKVIIDTATTVSTLQLVLHLISVAYTYFFSRGGGGG